MGTNVVRKGAGRKSAEEKRNRHAQRNPLPPKGNQIQDAKDVIEAAMKMIQAEMADGSKSNAKATAFLESIKPHGWTAELTVIEKSGDHIGVTARRGDETLFIEWMNGVYQNSATYTIADRTIKLRNASAAKQYASRTPETGQAELERVSSNKAFRRRPAEETSIKRFKLPFDPATASDIEVINALLGQGVVWHNRYRVVSESAKVGKDAKMCHITIFEGERIFNFCCPHTGFRSFRLSSLLKVGKVRNVTTAGQVNAGVEMGVEVE